MGASGASPAHKGSPVGPLLTVRHVGLCRTQTSLSLGVCLPGHLSAWTSVSLGVRLPGYLSVWTSVCLDIHLLGHLSSWASVCLGVHLPGRLSAALLMGLLLMSAHVLLSAAADSGSQTCLQLCVPSRDLLSRVACFYPHGATALLLPLSPY